MGNHDKGYTMLTPTIIRKFIDGLYRETYPGFIEEYRVEIRKMDDDRNYPQVILHVLIDRDVYLSIGEDFLAVEDMEDKLRGIIKYLPYPSDLTIVRYFPEYGQRSFHLLKDTDWETKFGEPK